MRRISIIEARELIATRKGADETLSEMSALLFPSYVIESDTNALIVYGSPVENPSDSPWEWQDIYVYKRTNSPFLVHQYKTDGEDLWGEEIYSIDPAVTSIVLSEIADIARKEILDNSHQGLD